VAAAAAGGGPPALVVRLLAEGVVPQVELRPARQRLGQLRVGYPSRHVVTLRNLGDGVLRYRLHAELVPEGTAARAPGGGDPGADVFAAADGCVEVDFSSGGGGGGGSAATQLMACSDPHGSSGAVDSLLLQPQQPPSEVVWVEEGQGTLPARGSRSLGLVLFPRRRGPHSIHVRCWAAPAAAPQPPQPHFASCGAPALAGGGWPQRPPTGPVAPAAPEAASCSLSALAVFPTVLVTGTASRQGVSKLRAWQQLEIAQLNAQLAAPVGPADLQVLAREAAGTMSTEAGLRLSPEAAQLDLGTHELGAPAAEFELQLTNPTELPVSWEVVNYDSPAVG
jgi:hypothetical protein